MLVIELTTKRRSADFFSLLTAFVRDYVTIATFG